MPTILTVWVFAQLYFFVQANVSVQINRGLVRLIVVATADYPHLTDDQLRSFAISQDESIRGNRVALAVRIKDPAVRRGARVNALEEFWVHGQGKIMGLLVALVLVCVVGVILASVVGKALWRSMEKFLMRTPGLKKVYPYIKQITDFLFTREKLSFSGVVAVQYPRKGVWSVALVTGTGLEKISEAVAKRLLTIFVPTSPTPFTGYVIMLPEEETIRLDMTIEEALRFTVSGGVITPATKGFFEKANANKQEPDKIE